MQVFEAMSALPSKMPITNPRHTVAFTAANSKKTKFAFTAEDVVEMLAVIEANIDDFMEIGQKYSQPKWRKAFATHFKEVAKTTSGNQTMMVFNLLSKAIHVSNPGLPSYSDEIIHLTPANLRRAIEAISEEIARHKMSRPEKPRFVDSRERLTGGRNLLLAGAPGVGKSHLAESIAKDAGGKAFRFVIHDDTQNSDFVGKVVLDEGRMRFEPGMFSVAYAFAVSNPGEPVYLIIEEVNRGHPGAIFGQVFQMLDRAPSGAGKYGVASMDSLHARWIEDATGIADGSVLRMPSNLHLIGTMNNSDDNVRPLDAAFQRRWIWQRVRLDLEKAPHRDVNIVVSSTEARSVAWKDFLAATNEIILESNIDEDRRRGPFCVPAHQMPDDGSVPQVIIEGLWNLLRHTGRSAMFNTKYKTLDCITQAAADGRRIFSQSFLGNLTANQTLPDDIPA